MPSWPSRLLHTSQAPSTSHSPEAGPSRFIKRGPDAEIPTSAPQESGIQARQGQSQIPRHGRSHSHPFTSMFGPTKKIDSRHRNESNLAVSRSQHSPFALSSDATSGKVTNISPEASQLTAQDMELISGKCATCGSAIKWPKHLSVFRCTICLMVNDIRPVEDGSQQQPDKEHGDQRKCSGRTGVFVLMRLSSS